MCSLAEEHIKRTVAGYTVLASPGYTNRHSWVAGYIHWTIYEHMGLEVTENSHEYLPERVINVKSTSIMKDVLVVRDGTVQAKLLDVIIYEDKEKTCLTDRYSFAR